jgi:hypothetical protein
MANESFFDSPETIDVLQRSVAAGWEVVLADADEGPFDVEFCFPLPTFKKDSDVVGDLQRQVCIDLFNQELAQGYGIALYSRTNRYDQDLPHFIIKMHFPIDNRFLPFLAQVSDHLIEAWLQEAEAA